MLTGGGLQIERRLAPFWRGLNDHSDSWTEHQLMAAARAMPIPPPDEIPPELEYKTTPKTMMTTPEDSKDPSSDSKGTQNLMVPISSRSQSYNSDGSQSSTPAQSLPSPTSPIANGSSFTSPLFRSRAKTLASLTTATKHGSQTELMPREFQLPSDPLVNGQPIEAYLYKDASECPICFLYYPPYLNRTRCCDQPICSECFVQIKRPDPHPPEHGDDPNNPNAAAAAQSEENRAESADTPLVSEPAACPFCVQPEFGVAYVPPPFRRGLAYASDPNSRPHANLSSPMSSSTSSLSSGNPTAASTGRRRATSLSANDPTVVTTDKIRPDWAQKLTNARAHAARRSAAATALHTAAYLANSNQSGGDSRNFSLGRRRRASAAPEAQSHSHARGSPALQALAFLTDRRAAPPPSSSSPPAQEAEAQEEGGGGPAAPPRGSSRRTRLDDLEEMMMMEAIRMSLASEDERRKREEKEVKKEAKRREKEAKKVEKTVRKSGIIGAETGSSALGTGTGTISPRDGRGLPISSGSSVIEEEEEEPLAPAKGKEADRASPSTTTAAGDESWESPSAPGVPADPTTHSTAAATEPAKPSHLRQMSSASSSFSSLVEDEHHSTYPTNGDGSQGGSTEPMFNFRSLAAVIGDEDDKGGEPAEHVEHLPAGPDEQGSMSTSTAPAGSAGAGDMTEPEHRECIMPKELETRSVEITGTRDPEAI